MPSTSLKADVLIVTVNEIESQSVLKAFEEETGKGSSIIEIDDFAYHDLGEVNGAKIFLMLSEMGSGGLGGSQQAVQNGISALSPTAVIGIGVAFGIDEQEQAIGDILVSKQLLLYDLKRIGTEIILRGDKPHSSIKLLNRFKNARLHWDNVKVHFGPILSGDKLVDNKDYRDELKKFLPEAIGGEMEGAGLYVACHTSNVEWILVKSICDWADGNKDQNKKIRQQKAASNAVSFLLHALKLTSFKLENKGDSKEDFE